MKDIFTRSKSMSREYCCSIVRIGDVIPVEGSDFLGKTIVDGFQIVVRKDKVKKGDIMFYASNECELNERFLSVNNEFDRSCYTKNSNFEETEIHIKEIEEIRKSLKDSSLDQDTIDSKNALIDIHENAIKGLCGFFNKYGRVKMINLRKCPSLGYLFTPEALYKFCPKAESVNLSDWVDDIEADHDFDTVNGELFVKAFIPRRNKSMATSSRFNKRQKNVDKIEKILPNQFFFHYDTQLLNKNIHRFSPDSEVYISAKIHGSSIVLGNLKTRKEKVYRSRVLNFFNSKLLPKKWRKYVIDYEDIYSSRTVIKNKDLNENVGEGFYASDIWSDWEKKLNGYIPKGMTIYGEIVGYLTNEPIMLQENYDYGCNSGESKLMIYRITSSEEDGSKREWEIDEVIDFTENLKKSIPQLMSYPLLYHGTLRDLYPEVTEDWENKVLENLKSESRFGMEENEPLCVNKVPREGIVIRIANDPLNEAFKLKCNKFLEMEGKEIDSGQIDIEMQDKYLG